MSIDRWNELRQQCRFLNVEAVHAKYGLNGLFVADSSTRSALRDGGVSEELAHRCHWTEVESAGLGKDVGELAEGALGAARNDAEAVDLATKLIKNAPKAAASGPLDTPENLAKLCHAVLAALRIVTKWYGWLDTSPRVRMQCDDNPLATRYKPGKLLWGLWDLAKALGVDDLPQRPDYGTSVSNAVGEVEELIVLNGRSVIGEDGDGVVDDVSVQDSRETPEVMNRYDWLRYCQDWAAKNLTAKQMLLVDNAGESRGELSLADIEILFEPDWRSDRAKKNAGELIKRLKKSIANKPDTPFLVTWNAKRFFLSPSCHILIEDN